jgi:hypothetical protein
MKRTGLLLLVLLSLCVSACAPVEPWERGNLAKPEMAFDFDPMQNRYREHVYRSREAAVAGDSAEGGGCGCY